MEQDIDIGLIVDLLSPIVIIIGSMAIWSFKTTAERIQRILDNHTNDIGDVRINLATLIEWRKGHSQIHSELQETISELRQFIESKLSAHEDKLSRYIEDRIEKSNKE